MVEAVRKSCPSVLDSEDTQPCGKPIVRFCIRSRFQGPCTRERAGAPSLRLAEVQLIRGVELAGGQHVWGTESRTPLAD